MIKNITLVLLTLGLFVILSWHLLFVLEPAPPKVPRVRIHVPYGYCGNFAIFWGDNIDPVDQPPEYLSYNYYPKNDKDAVLVRLPYPYEDAKVQFIYDTREIEGISGSVNPVFRYVSIGTIRTNTTRSETLADGTIIRIPGEEFNATTSVYEIVSLDTCLIHSNLDRPNLSSHFRAVLGVK